MPITIDIQTSEHHNPTFKQTKKMLQQIYKNSKINHKEYATDQKVFKIIVDKKLIYSEQEQGDLKSKNPEYL